jgi:poly-gamma-glutamate synthesis protein (capsule biosynthesis protein)
MKYLLVGILILAALAGIFYVRPEYITFFYSPTPDVYVASSTAIVPPQIKKQATLVFTGDVMLGRQVESLMKANGSDYPFKKIDSLLMGTSTDSAVSNLEGPITEHHVQTPGNGFGFSFATSTGPLLKQHNIDMVTLANNHTSDAGEDNFIYTTQILDAAGVGHFGHPFAFNNSYILEKDINGIHFIFVGFNITNPKFNYASATDLVAHVSKKEGEMLIVMSHGGIEYDLHSNKTQQDFYRKLIDAGADAVIGSHPHVVQEIEEYNGKPIFYSLGNFIFDQYFSKDVQEELAVKMTIVQENNKQKINYELIPIISAKSQPEVMGDKERQAFLAKLANKSSKNIQEKIKSGILSY